MSYQEHLKLCGYCQNIDSATKLAELGHIIKGISPISGAYAYPLRSTVLLSEDSS